MGNAVDGSVEGGALIRIYVAMMTIDTVDTKETVRIGGHGLEVSGGTIDLTGAHAGTTLKLQDDVSTSFQIGSADHPNLLSISTKTDDEYVAFTRDLKMVGDSTKDSTLYVDKKRREFNLVADIC